MHYVRFVARRIAQAVPVVFGVTLVAFILIHLVPGDPARTALGPHATPHAIMQLHRQWGLDRSLPAQYWLFLTRLIKGNLGTSFIYGTSVTQLIGERFGVTAWLVVYGALLSCLIAIPLSVVAASRIGGTRDGVVRLLSVTGLCLPTFWLAIVLIQYVAIGTGVFPAAGFGSGFFGHIRAMFLPSFTVAVAVAPLMIRSLRAEMLSIAQADYVTTARSKGLSERRIRLMHVLRNALVPAVTVLTVNIGFFIGSTLVVETIFSLPGLGQLMIQSIDLRDFETVQGLTLVLALMVISVNIAGDLVHGLLDPRIEAR